MPDRALRVAYSPKVEHCEAPGLGIVVADYSDRQEREFVWPGEAAVKILEAFGFAEEAAILAFEAKAGSGDLPTNEGR